MDEEQNQGNVPRISQIYWPLLEAVGDGLIHSISDVRERVATHFCVQSENFYDEENRRPGHFLLVFGSTQRDLISSGLVRRSCAGNVQITRFGLAQLASRSEESFWAGVKKIRKENCLSTETHPLREEKSLADLLEECSVGKPFDDLCKLASDQQWCWSLCCTTCGHCHFRYSFLELANGRYPANKNWRITSSRTNYSFIAPPPRTYSEAEKEAVINVCTNADLQVIATSCRFPDWLGYLGLVIHHMGGEPVAESFLGLSRNWSKQLSEMLPGESSLKSSLEKKAEGCGVLDISDLGEFEDMRIYRSYLS